jgi:hypothetical protein
MCKFVHDDQQWPSSLTRRIEVVDGTLTVDTLSVAVNTTVLVPPVKCTTATLTARQAPTSLWEACHTEQIKVR